MKCEYAVPNRGCIPGLRCGKMKAMYANSTYLLKKMRLKVEAENLAEMTS